MNNWFIQAAVLMCQTMWGPRWFVPKRFLPAKYDYHRPVVPREVAEGILDSSSAPVDVETGDGGEELAFSFLGGRQALTWDLLPLHYCL